MTTTHPNDDLFHALASRARATSDGRLVLDVVGGLAATLVIAAWRPPAWPILGSVALCAAAFGVWGIADREITERGATRPLAAVALRVVRMVSLALGVCAAVAAVLVLLRHTLGTWIS